MLYFTILIQIIKFSGSGKVRISEIFSLASFNIQSVYWI